MDYLRFPICRCLILLSLFYTSTLAFNSENCTSAEILKVDHIVDDPEMKFYLFTRQNPNEGQQIQINDSSTIEDSFYNNKTETRIMVHGWKGNITSCINAYVKDAYLNKTDYNIIIVDWYDWSREINYFAISTESYVNMFGELLAKFINFLNNYGTTNSNIYLIGHSMGAHICGVAGRNLTEKVHTIFGLDPSGPNYYGHPEKTLQCSDANYVEAIVTSRGTWGYNGVIGCSTYYPNYGASQSYCSNPEQINPVCNHVMAVKYFSESIKSDRGFCAVRCTYFFGVLLCGNEMSYDLRMGGEPSITNRSGTFYVKTNNASPFAMGC